LEPTIGLEASDSRCVIPPHIVGYLMSSVLEVKMINNGDNVRLVVPKSYFHQLGVERGDTLLVTVVEEKARSRKKVVRAHAQRARRHN
jgi:bifunctional DNA-binding transcriptional regulator/antitoxin component of YhaV-PrlF toxin-antitoxin module